MNDDGCEGLCEVKSVTDLGDGQRASGRSVSGCIRGRVCRRDKSVFLEKQVLREKRGGRHVGAIRVQARGDYFFGTLSEKRTFRFSFRV